MQIARATILMQDLVTLAVIFMRKRLDAVLKLFEALIYTIPFKVKKQWQKHQVSTKLVAGINTNILYRKPNHSNKQFCIYLSNI